MTPSTSAPLALRTGRGVGGERDRRRPQRLSLALPPLVRSRSAETYQRPASFAAASPGAPRRRILPWKRLSLFRRWRLDGTWERLNDELRELVRERAGRNRQPSAAILDSQSVRTTEKGGRVAMRARSGAGASAICSSIRSGCSCEAWCIEPYSDATGRCWCWTMSAALPPGISGWMRATRRDGALDRSDLG